jgi:GT2 family glycosyltransferase
LIDEYKKINSQEFASYSRKHKILTVILNYNDYEKNTEKCLLSLQGQYDVDQTIMVIDNGSDSNPIDRIRQEFPGTRYIRNGKNLGVAGGRNIGILYALKNNYDYVLIFDNDAVADRHMLSQLEKVAERDNSVGICGPKILERENTTRIYRAGCTHWKLTYLHCVTEIIRRLFRTAGWALPDAFDTIRGMGKEDKGQFDTARHIDFQLGAAALIRCQVFRKAGILDEQFNPYGSEDIDFCERTRKAGWKIGYVPQAICWHPAEGHDPDSYDRCFQNTKNIIILARKHLSIIYFWLIFIPDFSMLTIPLMLGECLIRKWYQRKRAILDAIKWNLNDIRTRGIFL